MLNSQSPSITVEFLVQYNMKIASARARYRSSHNRSKHVDIIPSYPNMVKCKSDFSLLTKENLSISLFVTRKMLVKLMSL